MSPPQMIMIDLQNLNSRWRREKNVLNQEMFTESKMHKPVGLHCSARNAVRQKHVDTKKIAESAFLLKVIQVAPPRLFH
ncbi:hypothetical protein C1N56_14155 [Pantoea sp. SGAir0175]